MSKVMDEVLLGLAADAYLRSSGEIEKSGAQFYSHIPLAHWNAKEIPMTLKMLENTKERLEAQGIYVPEINSGFLTCSPKTAPV